MPFLQIHKIWTDTDQMVQLEVTASNDSQVAKEDFYTYPHTVATFGQELQEFPKTSKDEVKLEYGDDPAYYCYLLLRAFVVDPSRCALEVKTDNRESSPHLATSHFFMTCEAATVNKLGAALCEWANDMQTDFFMEWEAP